MIEYSTMDDLLTIPEIEHFIRRHDFSNSFGTIDRYRANFVHHFQKLIAVRQVLTVRDEGKLVGICSWMIVDENRKKNINKTTWALPDNVSTGDIFYCDVCAIDSSVSLFKAKAAVREILNQRHFNIHKIFWFNMPQGRVFKAKFTGGKNLCLTAD